MSINQTKQNIISVGFKISLPADINELIWEQIDQTVFQKDTYPAIPDSVTCGVHYGIQCKGGLQDVHSSQEDMIMWYNRRCKRPDTSAYIRKIYVFQKPNIIMTELVVDKDRTYVFLAKNDRMHTTHYKKCINKNEYNGAPIYNIELVEPIKVTVGVYKHLS